MPSLVLTSNVKPADTEAFVLEFSKFSATVLKKPEVYISIDFKHNPHLTFAGSLDPAFLLVITSLGNLAPEQNEEYSPQFFKFIGDALGIADSRGYITFYDPGREYLGHKSTTFATIFGK